MNVNAELERELLAWSGKGAQVPPDTGYVQAGDRKLERELRRYFGKHAQATITVTNKRGRKSAMKVDEVELQEAMSAAGVEPSADGTLTNENLQKTVEYARKLGFKFLVSVLTGIGDGGGMLVRVDMKNPSFRLPEPVVLMPGAVTKQEHDRRLVIPEGAEGSLVIKSKYGSDSIAVDEVQFRAALDAAAYRIPMTDSEFSGYALSALVAAASSLKLTKLADELRTFAANVGYTVLVAEKSGKPWDRDPAQAGAGRMVMLVKKGDSKGDAVSEIELRAAANFAGEQLSGDTTGAQLFALVPAAKLLGLTDLEQKLMASYKTTAMGPLALRPTDGTAWHQMPRSEMSSGSLRLVNESGETVLKS